MRRAPPRKQHELTLLLMRNRRGNPRQNPALSIPPTHVADYSTKRNTTPQPPDSNRRASRDVRPSSFVVYQQNASITLVFKGAAPDPSALHPFCSGAALRNGCSATQRVQRYVMGAALRNGCSATQRVHHGTKPQREHRPTTEHNTPPHTTTTAATQAAVHPIRKHYTPSVRVQRYVTGAALRNGCSATQRVHHGTKPQREHRPTTERNTPPQQPQHKQQYTRSVSTTPLLFGCSAPQRVQRYTTGAAPHGGCSPLTRTPPP